MPDLKERWLRLDSKRELLSDVGIRAKLEVLLDDVYFCSTYIESIRSDGTLDEVFNIEKSKVLEGPQTIEPKPPRPETRKLKPKMERNLEILGEANTLPTDRLPTTREVLLYALLLLREELSTALQYEKSQILIKRLHIELIKNCREYHKKYQLGEPNFKRICITRIRQIWDLAQSTKLKEKGKLLNCLDKTLFTQKLAELNKEEKERLTDKANSSSELSPSLLNLKNKIEGKSRVVFQQLSRRITKYVGTPMDLDLNTLQRPSNREVLQFGLYLDIQDDKERAE